MAVALYNQNTIPFLQVFQKDERVFSLGGNLPPIRISQNWGQHGVAAVVWEAALVLGTFLLSLEKEISGKNVLELGSGTGFCGIVASLLRGNVTMTDLPGCLEICQNNVEANLDANLHQFSVVPLKWNSGLKKNWINQHFDYVVGADLVYIEETFQDLVETLNFFATNCNSRIFLSGKIRYKERFEQFSKIAEKSFKINYLKLDNITSIYVAELIKLNKL